MPSENALHYILFDFHESITKDWNSIDKDSRLADSLIETELKRGADPHESFDGKTILQSFAEEGKEAKRHIDRSRRLGCDGQETFAKVWLQSIKRCTCLIKQALAKKRQQHALSLVLDLHHQLGSASLLHLTDEKTIAAIAELSSSGGSSSSSSN